eukprot:4220052-Alexandrium_andersonii.AAC.1
MSTCACGAPCRAARSRRTTRSDTRGSSLGVLLPTWISMCGARAPCSPAPPRRTSTSPGA